MNKISGNTKLYEDMTNLLKLKQGNQISEEEYLLRAAVIGDDIITRKDFENADLRYQTIYKQNSINIICEFIQQKGLIPELKEHIVLYKDVMKGIMKEHNNLLMQYYNYIKQKGESLTKEQLDNYIDTRKNLEDPERIDILINQELENLV